MSKSYYYLPFSNKDNTNLISPIVVSHNGVSKRDIRYPSLEEVLEGLKEELLRLQGDTHHHSYRLVLNGYISFTPGD